MLLLAHVGYTVGAGWAAQRLRLKNRVDFRLLAFTAIFPDILDRTLYLLIIPDAQKGRLIAHTAVFQLASLSALVAIRRSFWFYGVASLAHLALDAQGLPTKHAFWPLLGSELENVNIVRGSAGAAGQSFGERVLGRLKVITNTYSKADMRAILLECGGLAVLAAFVVGTRLYERRRLLSLLRRGSAFGR